MAAPIIIALDGLDRKDAFTLVQKEAGKVWGVKIHDFLIREGFDVVTELKKFGKVFVDLKFHDIPTTVEKEVAALVARDVDLITVHAAGGSNMLKSAVAAGGEHVVAVTILTSLPDPARVPELAKLAAEAGVTNIVCSPLEIGIVKSAAPNARVITPGIRDPEDQKDDQKRTLSAREAIDAGAGLLVIGRPITKAPDPGRALDAIIATLF